MIKVFIAGKNLAITAILVVGLLIGIVLETQATNIVVPEGRMQAEVFSLTQPEQAVFAELKASFPFNGLVVRFPPTFPETDEYRLEIRVTANDDWGEWLTVEPLRDFPIEYTKIGELFSEPLFFGEAQQTQLRLIGDHSHDALAMFRELEVIYFDTRDGGLKPRSFLRKTLDALASVVDAASPVVSRVAWGANDQYRFAQDGTELWPRRYLPIQKLIIHHTAGSDGGADPAAVVRGVYYFHAVILGWGDMGYQYLIDPLGRIYEGRYGGEGVVGGHTYDERGQVNYNEGTVGIAILGNYEEGTLSEAAQESLTSLLAEKAWFHRLPPAGTSVYQGALLPNIVGHGEVDATICPGRNMRSSLETIRQEAQKKFDVLGPVPAPSFEAEFLSQSQTELVLQSQTQTALSVDFRNRGTTTWQSYVTDRRVILVPVAQSEAVKLQASSWSANEVTVSENANVQSGEIGRFTFSVQAPPDAVVVRAQFALQGPDGAELPNTRFTVTVRVTGLEYAAGFEKPSIPPASLLNSKIKLVMNAKNIGLQPWQKNDLYLHLYDLGLRPSRYRAATWRDPTGNVTLDQEVVNPGDVGTFTIDLLAPRDVGFYRQIVRLTHGSGEAVITDDFSFVTRVDSPWSAQFVSTNLTPAVRRTWRPSVVLRYKNTGATTWTRGLVLRVYDLENRPSPFRHASWSTVLADVRLSERAVAPGEMGTFVVRLKPPSAQGLYHQVFRLEVKGSLLPVQGGSYTTLTRVD